MHGSLFSRRDLQPPSVPPPLPTPCVPFFGLFGSDPPIPSRVPHEAGARRWRGGPLWRRRRRRQIRRLEGFRWQGRGGPRGRSADGEPLPGKDGGGVLHAHGEGGGAAAAAAAAAAAVLASR